MKLTDQIIDEAEEAARLDVLGYDPTDDQILDLVGDIVGVRLYPDNVYGMLAIAAYHRQERMVKFLTA